MQIHIMAELVHIQIFYQRCEEAAGALKYTQLLLGGMESKQEILLA
jgi:hypothetical protein